jgi:hypothetical protein
MASTVRANKGVTTAVAIIALATIAAVLYAITATPAEAGGVASCRGFAATITGTADGDQLTGMTSSVRVRGAIKFLAAGDAIACSAVRARIRLPGALPQTDSVARVATINSRGTTATIT